MTRAILLALLLSACGPIVEINAELHEETVGLPVALDKAHTAWALAGSEYSDSRCLQRVVVSGGLADSQFALGCSGLAIGDAPALADGTCLALVGDDDWAILRAPGMHVRDIAVAHAALHVIAWCETGDVDREHAEHDWVAYERTLQAFVRSGQLVDDSLEASQ